MKQSFADMHRVMPGAIQIDAEAVAERTVRQLFNSIALHIQRGEYYADPQRSHISGWMQQGLNLADPGADEFVQYTIKVRVGSQFDHDDASSPTIYATATVDDGIDQ